MQTRRKVRVSIAIVLALTGRLDMRAATRLLKFTYIAVDCTHIVYTD